MKYKLTEETLTLDNGKVLHRIQALKDFANVKAGDLGGWIESESNLSQSGDCWVDINARVYDNAQVKDNARVCDHSTVFENASILNNSRVMHTSKIFGNASVKDNARVYYSAKIYDSAVVTNHAIISNYAEVFGNSQVRDTAIVGGHARVCKNSVIIAQAFVDGFAFIENGEVYGPAHITGNAIISSLGDYMVFQNTWSSGRFFTWTKSNNMWKVGCFYGTGKELIEKAYKDSQRSGDCYKACVELVEKLNLA